MKKLIYLFTIAWSLNVSAQEINVSISGMIFSPPVDTVYVSQFFGNYFKDYYRIPIDKKGNFQMTGNLPAADYYILRVGDVNVQLILRKDSQVKIYGDGKKLRSFCNIVGSDESKAMNDFAIVSDKWRQKSDSAINAMRTDPSREQIINQYMQQEYTNFQTEFQNFIANNPNSAALIMALGAINPEQDFQSYESLITQIQQSFSESPTVQSYYKNYLALKKKIEDGQKLAPGKLAPDFEELSVDRKKSIKLSSLRGQVVLVDFWASWCGPCRRENPNVVKTYEKYKNDGFTIVSVSLDTDKAKWMEAIKHDNLSWPNHVSDLGGWNSKVPQIYGVNSVPFTVLIDKEGKIIQTNLRGEALEVELQKIFGH